MSLLCQKTYIIGFLNIFRSVLDTRISKIKLKFIVCYFIFCIFMSFTYKKYLTISVIITSIFLSLSQYCQWYFFGLKSTDDTISNIQEIEAKYKIHIPVVGFIFDGFSERRQDTIKRLKIELWANRIYHITISPKWFSAKDVADGKFDESYKTFFEIVKEQNITVIFRTMHEMNGWRYSRSQDPISFKKAWIRIRNLSRKVGLDQNNILFDFSVNHRDVPIKPWQKPWKQSEMFFCNISTKVKTNCLTREDFYPGRKYVDVIWFTFYNRGKANYNRLRLEPDQILNDPNWKTLERLKYYKKPLFVDEVGTTAVQYNGKYDADKSLDYYIREYDRKNNRLKNLASMLYKESQIVWVMYFNCDFTDGLQNFQDGEADRAVINLSKDKYYFGLKYLFQNSENDSPYSALLWLFGLDQISLSSWNIFVPKDSRSEIISNIRILKKKYSDNDLILAKLQELIEKYNMTADPKLPNTNRELQVQIVKLKKLIEIFTIMAQNI